MSEQILLEDKQIKVTPSLVTLYGTTYAVANITSVRVIEKSGVRVAGYLLGSLGALILLGSLLPEGTQGSSPGGILIGLVLLMVGVLFVISGVSWEMYLTMGSTERSGFQGRDQKYLQKIAASINEAIVLRSNQAR